MGSEPDDRWLRGHCVHTLYNAERNHQGLGNSLIAPIEGDCVGQALGRVRRRARLGGLLNFYHRAA